MKSLVSPEPEAFDVWPTRFCQAVRLGVFLQLLEVSGTCGILYEQGLLDGVHPVLEAAGEAPRRSWPR